MLYSAGAAAAGPPDMQRTGSIDVLAEEQKEKEQKAQRIQFTNDEVRAMWCGVAWRVCVGCYLC